MALHRGLPCYVLGPERDAAAATWCCKPTTRITAYGSCDPRFPKHLKDVKSLDELPANHGMNILPDAAIADGSTCYAPGPHTAFNIANWCCQ